MSGRGRTKLRNLISALAQGNQQINPPIKGFKEYLIRDIFNFLIRKGTVNEYKWDNVKRNFIFTQTSSSQYNSRPMGARMGFNP